MPHFRIRTIRTREASAWQWFPTGHPQHPALPPVVEQRVHEEPDTGKCRVFQYPPDAPEPTDVPSIAEPGDWIVFDPDFGLRTIGAEDFIQATRPVETENAIAQGPQGPPGHRRAHEQAAQIIGRLIGVLHTQGARYDIDRDCHRLVAYLDYLADQVGHARRIVQPMARLRDALEPRIQEVAGRVHQSDLIYGAINLYLADGGRVLTDVEFTCRLRDLEDARRILGEPPPLSAETPDVETQDAAEPAREYPAADLSDVEPEQATPDPDADVGLAHPPAVCCPDCEQQQPRIRGQAEYHCPACGCTFTDESPEPDEES